MSTPIVGACADHDPELWFSTAHSDRQEARIICQSCPMATPCARAAMDVVPHHGMWAGVMTKGRTKADICADLAPIAAGAPIPVPDRDLQSRVNRSAISALHRRGLTQAEIASQLGLSHSNVGHHLVKLNVVAA